MRLKIEMEIENIFDEISDKIFLEWVKMKFGYKSFRLSNKQIEEHLVLLDFIDLDEGGGVIKKRITKISGSEE